MLKLFTALSSTLKSFT